MEKIVNYRSEIYKTISQRQKKCYIVHRNYLDCNEITKFDCDVAMNWQFHNKRSSLTVTDKQAGVGKLFDWSKNVY